MATVNGTVSLYLNALQKTILYKGITKYIDDAFWEQNLVPILYPFWDSDKDRLETFVYYEDGSVYVTKNKFLKNFKTGQFYWSSYEFNVDELNRADVDDLYQKLVDIFQLYKEKENFDLQSYLRSKYSEFSHINWAKVVLIRNFLLQDSDWVFMEDSPVDAEKKEMWKLYRKTLRDIPQEQRNQDPFTVKFPVTPDFYYKENLSGDYLSGEDHFFYLDSNILKNFTEKMVAYLTIAVTTKKIDEMEFHRVQIPDKDATLDDLIFAIETDLAGEQNVSI